MINKISSNYKKILTKINNVKLQRDIAKCNIKPASRPNAIILNLSTKCNYNCPMCSIKIAKEMFPHYHNNMITCEIVDTLHRKQGFFRGVTNFSFMGLLGEPLLNPHFFKIVEYLRENTSAIFFVSTNGQLLNEINREKFFEVGFEEINVSIHAATEDIYKKLQAGNFKTVLSNIKNLASTKKNNGFKYPNIHVVIALNWWNIYELSDYFDLMKEIAPDSIYVYHYRDYGGINNKISLKEGDIAKANDLIVAAYEHADKIGIKNILLPKGPPLVLAEPFVSNHQNSRFCNLPWTGLQMRGCVVDADSFYVGCCNVFNIFKLNYSIYKNSFETLWHHPIFQYLRKTVNSNKTNPICAYCKSSERNYLKSIDNKKNNEKKSIAISEFYEDFYKVHGRNLNCTPGLDVLLKDPDDIRLE